MNPPGFPFLQTTGTSHTLQGTQMEPDSWGHPPGQRQLPESMARRWGEMTGSPGQLFVSRPSAPDAALPVPSPAVGRREPGTREWGAGVTLPSCLQLFSVSLQRRGRPPRPWGGDEAVLALPSDSTGDPVTAPGSSLAPRPRGRRGDVGYEEVGSRRTRLAGAPILGFLPRE